jgi:hypothetical protein
MPFSTRPSIARSSGASTLGGEGVCGGGDGGDEDDGDHDDDDGMALSVPAVDVIHMPYTDRALQTSHHDDFVFAPDQDGDLDRNGDDRAGEAG